MECPYCKKEMREGYLHAYRSEPEWCFGPVDRAPISEPVSVRLADPDLFASKNVASWYCPDCKVVITPVREYETTWDKMKDKWKRFTERTAKARQEHVEERQEEQREKVREKRRKKDPWEV